jgi:hypothetical protein
MPTTEIKFTVTVNIPEQRVNDLVCAGMESGCYGSFTIVGYENESGPYRHIDTPFKGGTILMQDKYGDEPTVYRLDLAALKKGLQILGEKYPHLMSDFVNENEDAITGDAYIQCCLLGDIVYG